MAERTTKVTLIANISQYLAGMEQASKKTRETATESEKLAQKGEAFQKVGTAALAFGTLAAAGVGLAISKYAEFDAAMSEVDASTHETAGNMALLRDAAIDAGASTVFSATEAANAIDELAKAGLATTDILGGGLTGALNLASAGGLGVARAAEISATTLSQFGLAGSQAGHVADLLAAGAGKALGSVEDLSQGLNVVGPIAASMGISLEETTGTLALFAQQGILGSEGGTALRGVLASLTAPADKARKEIERLGIELYDSQGNFLGLENAAGQLSEAYGTMDAESRDASLGIIFGRETMTAATAIYRAGAEGISEATDSVNDYGYASDTAARKLDNLSGDVEALGGAFDTALIQSGSAANDSLRFLTSAATDALDAFNGMPEGVQGVALGIGAVAAAAALTAGVVLTSVPKIAEFNSALAKMGPNAQKAAKGAVGLGKAVGVLAALSGAVIVLDKIASSGDKAATGVEQTTTALLKAQGVDQLFDGLGGDVRDFSSALELVIGGSVNSNVERFGSTLNGIFAGGQLADQVQKSREQFDNIGQSLAGLVNGGEADKAKDLFDELSTSAEKQGFTTEQLLELFPAYKDALAGLENGQILAAESGEETSTSLEQIAGVATTAKEEIEGLSDALRSFGEITFNVIEAEASFYEAIDAASAAVGAEGFAMSLDQSTEAGRNNMGMLTDIASSTNEFAAATFDSTGDVEKLNGVLADGRQRLVDQALAFGATEQQANDYADQLIATPDTVQTFVGLNGASEAESTLTNLTRDREITLTMVTRNVTQVINQVLDDFGPSTKKASGGIITGPGTGTSDSIIAAVSNGEYIVRAAQTEKNRGALEFINSGGVIPGYAGGGYVSQPAYMGGGFAAGPSVSSVVEMSGTFYAYDPSMLAREAERERRRKLALSGVRF